MYKHGMNTEKYFLLLKIILVTDMLISCYWKILKTIRYLWRCYERYYGYIYGTIYEILELLLYLLTSLLEVYNKWTGVVEILTFGMFKNFPMRITEEIFPCTSFRQFRISFSVTSHVDFNYFFLFVVNYVLVLK